ncbi:MAG: hypothetical protein CL677_08625 [Bdellovibrionaceae bacterium]|nr:hypothetical protein [Pseudobdellovibrionaceae bacterium]|tara:strand:- start:599 stop:874 length:276 start_codon:yes stop_codon:yes gene_type:complete
MNEFRIVFNQKIKDINPDWVQYLVFENSDQYDQLALKIPKGSCDNKDILVYVAVDGDITLEVDSEHTHFHMDELSTYFVSDLNRFMNEETK